MREITFDKFVQDYNEYYQTNLRTIRLDTNLIEEIIDNLYENNDYEIDYHKEIITLY